MAPYISLTLIRSFLLPTWLGGQRQAFKATGSIKSSLNERNPRTRAPMYRRIWTILVNYLAGFHVAYVYFVLVAVVISTYRCFLQHSVRAKLVCLVTHAFWVRLHFPFRPIRLSNSFGSFLLTLGTQPPLAWASVVSSFWIPLAYATDPPNMPDREELLNRDKRGIAHPTNKAKKISTSPQSWCKLPHEIAALVQRQQFLQLPVYPDS